MGKASRTKQAPDRRARIAAQQAAAKRAEQRKRIYLAGGSILVVVAVVLTFVLIKTNSKSGQPPFFTNGPTGAALTSLTKDVTNVPQNVLDQVGAGNISKQAFIPASEISQAAAANAAYFATVNGKALTSAGKPEILYIGAGYCPFCGAQRWSMIVSLSKFGTFSGLTTQHSSSTDYDANTASWDFYGSKYTSPYITFVPVEETTNERIGNTSNVNTGYTTLQNPTNAEEALLQQYDPYNPTTQTGGAIPFIDMGNKYVQVGNLGPYGPDALKGKNWTQIAAALTQPTSTIGQGADGSANYMTAAICQLTNNQPATACTPAIQALEKNFAAA